MESIGERIRYLRKNILGKSQKEFGEIIGLKSNSISCIETGTNAPTEQNLRAICREFGVSYLWLTEGKEPMQEPIDSDSMTRIDNIMAGENEFAKNLFREFAKLGDSEWRVLEKLIKNIAKEIE